MCFFFLSVFKVGKILLTRNCNFCQKIPIRPIRWPLGVTRFQDGCGRGWQHWKDRGKKQQQQQHNSRNNATFIWYLSRMKQFRARAYYSSWILDISYINTCVKYHDAPIQGTIMNSYLTQTWYKLKMNTRQKITFKKKPKKTTTTLKWLRRGVCDVCAAHRWVQLGVNERHLADRRESR